MKCGVLRDCTVSSVRVVVEVVEEENFLNHTNSCYSITRALLKLIRAPNQMSTVSSVRVVVEVVEENCIEEYASLYAAISSPLPAQGLGFRV